VNYKNNNQKRLVLGQKNGPKTQGFAMDVTLNPPVVKLKQVKNLDFKMPFLLG
jgi:hypothetical protein